MIVTKSCDRMLHTMPHHLRTLKHKNRPRWQKSRRFDVYIRYERYWEIALSWKRMLNLSNDTHVHMRTHACPCAHMCTHTYADTYVAPHGMSKRHHVAVPPFFVRAMSAALLAAMSARDIKLFFIYFNSK